MNPSGGKADQFRKGRERERREPEFLLWHGLCLVADLSPAPQLQAV